MKLSRFITWQPSFWFPGPSRPAIDQCGRLNLDRLLADFCPDQWRNQEFMLGVLMFPSPPLALEVGPQIQLGGLGERCKLAEIDCGAFLALKYAIWWQQF